MKKFILFVMAALVLFLSVEASAKKSKEEKENENVIEVTLTDGKVEKGRVTTYWTYPMKKGYSRTFKIKTDDGRDIKFDVTDIDSLYFPLRTEEQFRTYRPMLVPRPKIGNKSNVEEWICAVGKRSEHAQLYFPSIWVNYQATPTQSRNDLFTLPSIKFDCDSIAYPFYYYHNGNFNISVIKHWLNKSNPELYDYLNDYFKKNKKAKKEIGDRPEIMLEVYEEYLRTKSEQ